MMNFTMKGTENTFAVTCQAETGLVELVGSSFPDNARDFFEPIYSWVNAYIREHQGPLETRLKIFYISSSSSKCLLDLFDIFDRYCEQGGQVKVTWLYSKTDEYMLETGRDFSEDLSLAFELVAF